MEASDDDDIIVVSNDNSPQIIKIDLSDEESCVVSSDPLIISDGNSNGSLEKPNTVFQNNNSEEKQLDSDTIDLDGDDIDALAPLRSVINSVKGNTRMKALNHVDKRHDLEHSIKRFSASKRKRHLSPGKESHSISEMRQENFGMDIPVNKYIVFKPNSNENVTDLEPTLVSSKTPYTLTENAKSTSTNNGNGIIDLNINITNASSPLTSNVDFGFQSTTNQWQNTSPQYNVALGLVVNVNQRATRLEDIKEKKQRLGDIAVNISMSDKNRYPVDLTQAKPRTNMYKCTKCSLKTKKLQTINSHVCKPRAVKKKLANKSSANKAGTSQHLVCKKTRLGPERDENLHKTVTYQCLLCSLETDNLEVMKRTKCFKHQICHPNKLKEFDKNPPDKRFMEITGNTKGKTNVCRRTLSGERPSKSPDSESLKKPQEEHNSFEPNGNSNNYPRRKYHCLDCSFSSRSLSDLNIHICPKNTLTWNENSASEKFDDFDIFNTLFHKLFKSYEYVGQSPVPSTDAASRSRKQSPQFSCLACHFKTNDIKQVNTHKCQKDSLMYKIDTAVQTMKRKFDFEKVYVCALCKEQFYFNCSEAFSFHYAVVHKGVSTMGDKTLNRCTFCGDIMDDTLIKAHFSSHICQYENVIKSYFFQDDFVDLISRLGETPLDSRNSSEVSDKGQIICYSCKQEIGASGMKCVNPECGSWYHIQCCNIYSRQLLPQEVIDFPDWFCHNCNKKEDRNLSTAEDNIEVVDFCLYVTDNLLRREMDIQNTMLTEIKKIKAEKQATKEEFARIKNFIMNSKSKRINNPLTRAVFSIVERFIDGGNGDLGT